MKKLFLNLLVVVLILQLALPVANTNKLLSVALGAEDADTGGMQYANWYFRQNNLKEVNVVIEINNDPLTEDGLYFQAYDGYINGQMFYFGLQTKTGKPGSGLTGKGLIFSEFGTTDSTNIKTAPSGWYEVGTYEGPFISTRVGYDWTNHKYILTIKYKESDTVGDWYEFWIEDLTTSSKTFTGALRFPFPQDLSKKGITDGGGSWTEIYYRKVQGTPLPEWSISILEVSAVSKDGTIIFPKSAHLKNADNFYHVDQVFHPKNNKLDFVIGGNATKSFNEKDITLSSGTINLNATLNGSPWNGALNFTLTREKTYSYTTAPVILSGYPIGTYTIQYDSYGPINATLSSITPSSTQILTSGSTVTFTLNFTTQKLNLLYIIVVANPSLKDTVQDLVKFKESQGFDVIVEDVPTIEQNYQGIDRVEKIRNFLKDKVKGYPKTFTLLIGPPYDKNQANSISTGGDIPMRIITPQSNDTSVQYPTDFYYADLDGNWDSNNDGKYGTEKDEIKEQVHNFVGRIPFSENTAVKRILFNTIDSWHDELKKKALLATSKMEGSNYDYAIIAEKIRLNIFEPAGFSVNTLYEKEGTNPSTYSCTASLNEENFNKYLCGNDIIITYGHGGVFREVWYDNNKNGVVDSNEIEKLEFFSLNDLNATQCKTKIWFDFGCVNAFKSWEVYFNTTQEPWFVTADAILEKGIAAVVIGSTYESAVYDSDIETACNTIITSHLPVGEWLYNKVYSRGIKYYERAFNILGDPSFGLFDDSLAISADITPPAIQITTPMNDTFTKDPTVTISGTVTDDLSGIQKVIVGKKLVTIDKNGNFTTDILLNEGPNDISIIATDKAGNTSTTTLTIYYKWKQMIVLNLTIGNPYLLVNLVPQEIDPGRGTTPVIKNGRTLVPIRAIVEALGGTVGWDGNEKKVTVTLGSTTIELWIGKNTARVNGIDTLIDPDNSKVVPEIINGRTMLPLRFVTENLGCQLRWDPNTKTITITYQGG